MIVDLELISGTIIKRADVFPNKELHELDDFLYELGKIRSGLYCPGHVIGKITSVLCIRCPTFQEGSFCGAAVVLANDQDLGGYILVFHLIIF